MKSRSYILFVFPFLVMAALFVSCQDGGENGEKKPTKLNLDRNIVEVPSCGGNFSVRYQVENPVEGALVDPCCKEKWVMDLQDSDDMIVFSVAENEAENQREALVDVKYPGIYPDVQFRIVQGAFKVPMLHLQENQLEFPEEGGSGTIHYSLENAIEGVGLSFKCDEEWITDIKDDMDQHVISFHVARNPKVVSRSAEIEVLYEKAEESCRFVVVQSKNIPEVPEIKTIEVNGVALEMVRVTGGTFTMGGTEDQKPDANKDEYPLHKVTLSDYYIGKYETTQELWTAVMGDNPSYWDINPKLPIEQVTWDKVQGFIQKLNELTGLSFALPTESQWEFAARGGNNSLGYMYSGSNNLDSVAWFADNSESKTHEVGTKQPNELGIYDMSGNVQEWCSDFYGDYLDTPSCDPQGPEDGLYRILRGGSFLYFSQGCRIASRAGSSSSGGDRSYGFRLVLAK